jgi:hypothetical protein
MSLFIFTFRCKHKYKYYLKSFNYRESIKEYYEEYIQTGLKDELAVEECINKDAKELLLGKNIKYLYK